MPHAPRTLEFWFDYASPYAYLAAAQIPALAARTGSPLRWRPLLLGALFRAVGQADVPLFAMNPARQAYQGVELSRAARWWGTPFRFNPHFPLRTVLPLRLTLAAEAAGHAPGPLILATFRAAWAEERDIAQPDTLAALLAACRLPADLLDQAATQKDALFAANAEAQARGVFGVPTCFVRTPARDWMFWGQDRLGPVESCLRGDNPPGEVVPE